MNNFLFTYSIAGLAVAIFALAIVLILKSEKKSSSKDK